MTNWLSEIVWSVWAAVGVAWEMVGVFGEKKWRQEPLTRIVRDRLMRSKLGIIFRLIFIAFMGWLFLHWMLPLDW